MKYVFPHPGSSHLYVRRWDTGNDNVTASVWVEDGLTVEDAAADDAGCLATDGGAGAMGQRRLELCGGSGDVAGAQLTTMIAVGADVSGSSMPPTLVRTTGTETGLSVAFSFASAVTETVDGCGCNMLFDDEEKFSSLAAAAVNLPSDGTTGTHIADKAADWCKGPVCPGT